MYTANQDHRQTVALAALRTATTAGEVQAALARISATLQDCFYVDSRAAIRSARQKAARLESLRVEHARRMAERMAKRAK